MSQISEDVEMTPDKEEVSVEEKVEEPRTGPDIEKVAEKPSAKGTTTTKSSASNKSMTKSRPDDLKQEVKNDKINKDLNDKKCTDSGRKASMKRESVDVPNNVNPKVLKLGNNSINMPNTFNSKLGLAQRDITSDFITEINAIVTRRRDIVNDTILQSRVIGLGSIHSVRTAYREVVVTGVFDSFHAADDVGFDPFIVRFDAALEVASLNRSDGEGYVRGGVIDSRGITSALKGSIQISRSMCEIISQFFFDSLIVYDMQYIFMVAHMLVFKLNEAAKHNEIAVQWENVNDGAVRCVNVAVENAELVEAASAIVCRAMTDSSIVLLRKHYTNTDINVMRAIGSGFQCLQTTYNHRQHVSNHTQTQPINWVLLQSVNRPADAWVAPTASDITGFVKRFALDLKCEADILKGFVKACSIYYGIKYDYWIEANSFGLIEGHLNRGHPHQLQEDVANNGRDNLAARADLEAGEAYKRLSFFNANRITVLNQVERLVNNQVELSANRDVYKEAEAVERIARYRKVFSDLSEKSKSRYDQMVKEFKKIRSDSGINFKIGGRTVGGTSKAFSSLPGLAGSGPPSGASDILPGLEMGSTACLATDEHFGYSDSYTPSGNVLQPLNEYFGYLRTGRTYTVMDPPNDLPECINIVKQMERSMGAEIGAISAANDMMHEQHRVAAERLNRRRIVSAFLPASLEMGGTTCPRPQCVNILWRCLELMTGLKTPSWALTDLSSWYSIDFGELNYVGIMAAAMLTVSTSQVLHTCNLAGSQMQCWFAYIPRNSKSVLEQLYNTKDIRKRNCYISESVCFIIPRFSNIILNPLMYYMRTFSNGFVDVLHREEAAGYALLSGNTILYIIRPLCLLRMIKNFPDIWGVASPEITMDLSQDMNMYHDNDNRGWFSDLGCSLYKDAFSGGAEYAYISYGVAVLNTFLQHYERRRIEFLVHFRRFTRAGKAGNMMDIVEAENIMWDEESECIHIGSVLTYDWETKRTQAVCVIGEEEEEVAVLRQMSMLTTSGLDAGYITPTSMRTHITTGYGDIDELTNLFDGASLVDPVDSVHSDSVTKNDPKGN